jgi:hypothetical protein
MRQFIPMTDELLFGAASLPGPLVPYRTGVQCWHALIDGCVTLFGSEPARASAETERSHALTAESVPYASPASAASESQTAAASACR